MTTDWDALDACVTVGRRGLHRVLKIVVFDDADYHYARTVSTRYPALPVYLQVGNPAPLKHARRPLPDEADIDDLLARFRWLVGKVTADHWFAATVLPQLHVLAWGNKRGAEEQWGFWHSPRCTACLKLALKGRGNTPQAIVPNQPRCPQWRRAARA